jgi:iron complex transport system substrate-binding protein
MTGPSPWGHRARSPSRRQWLLAMAAAPLAAAPPGHANTLRIVCVGGALTETVFALGAQANLVGVDTTSLHPAAAQSLPSVGYARALSAEGVLSLRPGLVLATQDAGPPDVLRQLEAARVGLTVLDAGHRFEGVLVNTQRLAALCGREEAGALLVANMQQAWARAANAMAQRKANKAPKVLFVLSHSMAQVRVSGRGTAADAMLVYAGGGNVLADLEGYKPLTPEGAIAAAPDVILTTEQGLEAAGGIDGLLKAPGLAQTPAGRARRVVAMDALLMLGFGPRLPQAVLALADLLAKAPHAKPA